MILTALLLFIALQTSSYNEYQITTHTWIEPGEIYYIGGPATIPVDKQPYIEILNTPDKFGNIVAKAWNGNEHVIIYEFKEIFD